MSFFARNYDDMTVNRFREKRGRRLARQLRAVADRLDRKISVLDVGGRPDYWRNIKTDAVAEIVLLNYDAVEFDRTPPAGTGILFRAIQGDARNLSGFADGSVDFVHSNSVIEHVGSWGDMWAMASEVRRVGEAGWVQTPAFEFPVEPHFQAPFLHWFGQPIRRRLLTISRLYRKCNLGERRGHVDRINLLSKAEVKALFAGCELHVERFALLPKSYVVQWGPDVGSRHVNPFAA
jgi:hypothetical protein